MNSISAYYSVYKIDLDIVALFVKCTLIVGSSFINKILINLSRRSTPLRPKLTKLTTNY